MFSDDEDPLEDLDHRFALVRDRSTTVRPGKYLARPKVDQPRHKFSKEVRKRCKKFPIRDIEVAKSIVKKARANRKKAQAEDRISRRTEDRYYICETCSRNKARIYHTTSISDQEYAAKFEASKRGEYVLAA